MSDIKIENAIHKMDMILRPNVCFIHPDTLEVIKKIEPDIEKQILFRPTEMVDKDKCYIMKREDLERMAFGMSEVEHE